MFQSQPVFHCLRSGEKLTQLSLVIPGLCGPLPETDRIDNVSVKSLVLKLSKADWVAIPQNNFHDVLAMLFAMDDVKPFPAAVLSLLASDQYTEQGYWFHADPVHLQVDMDHAILRDTHGLDLTLEESEALVAELNAYFSDEGIRFIINDKDSWFLHAHHHEKICTTPVHDVISRNVYTFMPQGEDALFWKKFMNEVQMLLHQSPVNENRIDNGKLPVNGAWLWGEGTLPDQSGIEAMEVFGRHPVVEGLATLNNLDFYSVPSVDAFINRYSEQLKTLLVLDDLFDVTCYGDVMAWQSSFNDLYTNWLEPILHWAKKNKIKVNLYPCNGVRYHLSGHNKFKFFRDKRIASYIKTYE